MMMEVFVLACVVFGQSVLASAPVCYLNEYTGLYYNPYYSKYPVTEAKIVRRVRSHRPVVLAKEQQNLQNQQPPTVSTQVSQDGENHNNEKRALPFSKIITYDNQPPYYCPICNEPLIKQEEHSTIRDKQYNGFASHNHKLPPRTDLRKLSPAERFIYELSHLSNQQSSEQAQIDNLNNPQRLYDMEMKLLEGKLPNWEEFGRFGSSKKSSLRKSSYADKKSKLSAKLQSMENYSPALNYSLDDDDFYCDSYPRYERQMESITVSPTITKTIKTEETAVLSKAPGGQSKPQATIVVTKNVEEIETNSPRRIITDQKVMNNGNTKPQKLEVKEEN